MFYVGSRGHHPDIGGITPGSVRRVIASVGTKAGDVFGIETPGGGGFDTP